MSTRVFGKKNQIKGMIKGILDTFIKGHPNNKQVEQFKDWSKKKIIKDDFKHFVDLAMSSGWYNKMVQNPEFKPLYDKLLTMDKWNPRQIQRLSELFLHFINTEIRRTYNIKMGSDIVNLSKLPRKWADAVSKSPNTAVLPIVNMDNDIGSNLDRLFKEDEGADNHESKSVGTGPPSVADPAAVADPHAAASQATNPTASQGASVPPANPTSFSSSYLKKNPVSTHPNNRDKKKEALEVIFKKYNINSKLRNKSIGIILARHSHTPIEDFSSMLTEVTGSIEHGVAKLSATDFQEVF